jgi:hypothetical protein
MLSASGDDMDTLDNDDDSILSGEQDDLDDYAAGDLDTYTSREIDGDGYDMDDSSSIVSDDYEVVAQKNQYDYDETQFSFDPVADFDTRDAGRAFEEGTKTDATAGNPQYTLF